MSLAVAPTPPGRGWFRLRTLVLAGGALVAGWIGFLSATADLWDKIWPAKSDTQILLLPDENQTIATNEHHPLEPVPDVLKTGILIIDGVPLPVPPDGLVVANHIEMRHGGSITGSRFSIAATTIEGGEITATGKDGSSGPKTAVPSHGDPGGAVLVATASISGTPVRSDGGGGGVGGQGASGQAGGAGGSGCVGLGGSQNGARNGPDGARGSDGTSGLKGPAGRNGTAVLRIGPFEHVSKESQKAGGDKDRFVSALKKLQN
jgi:hypothetical protein